MVFRSQGESLFMVGWIRWVNAEQTLYLFIFVEDLLITIAATTWSRDGQTSRW